MFSSQRERSPTEAGGERPPKTLKLEPVRLLRTLERCRALVRSGAHEAWIDGEQAATERTYLRLAASPAAEAWLIRWPPGSVAPLHDHGAAYGLAHVIEGALHEWRFEPESAHPHLRKWTSSRAVELAHGTCHEVRNLGRDTAYSIHVYAPRLAHMTFYARAASGKLEPLRREAASQW